MFDEIILVRHGESLANASRDIDTSLPGPALTDRGREQATWFAASLDPTPPQAVYCSPALRAQQTAQALGERFDQPVVTVDGFEEVEVGDYQGRSDAEAWQVVNSAIHAWIRGEQDHVLAGAPAAVDTLARLRRAFAAIGDRGTGRAVVAMHGGSARLLATALDATIDRAFAVRRGLANTQTITLTRMEGQRWTCVQWGAADEAPQRAAVQRP